MLKLTRGAFNDNVGRRTPGNNARLWDIWPVERYRRDRGGHRHRVLGGDGGACMFTSPPGDVQPSPRVPVAGNVRDTSPVALDREAPLFVALRDPDRLGGRCGRCGCREVCGGSRARAYATFGDPFAEDPTCVFEPDDDATL